jgi:hypothetical protein
MSDQLATYLHDHLAGSRFAIELLEAMQKQYAGKELGAFATEVIKEVKEDQDTLKQIIEHVGKGYPDLAELAGWLGEKASKLKLRHDGSDGGIGTFEALEALSLGIIGKLALWNALPVIRGVDPRIPPYDFAMLARRAEDQFSRAERHRLDLATVAFGTHPD